MHSCSHERRRAGRCPDCGACDHDVILNGACFYCGSTEIEPTGGRGDTVPIDRLRKRR